MALAGHRLHLAPELRRLRRRAGAIRRLLGDRRRARPAPRLRRHPRHDRRLEGRSRPAHAVTRIGASVRTAALLFLGFSLLYVAISRGVFLYGDDILMFQVTEGLVERGDPAVTSPADRADVAR